MHSIIIEYSTVINDIFLQLPEIGMLNITNQVQCTWYIIADPIFDSTVLET